MTERTVNMTEDKIYDMGIYKKHGVVKVYFLYVSWFFYLIDEKVFWSSGADPGYVKRRGRDPKGGAGWLI